MASISDLYKRLSCSVREVRKMAFYHCTSIEEIRGFLLHCLSVINNCTNIIIGLLDMYNSVVLRAGSMILGMGT